MKEKKPVIALQRVSFCYPEAREPVLRDIALSVFPGEMAVLCGQSGCGKTTLLRHMKKNQIPFGSGSGRLLFDGRDLEEMDDREAAARIGYVGQDPDSQIVTDTVWHEMAFGLENLGVPAPQIRRRTAEMAEYFGMGSVFRRPVAELSGGQKQLLSLASVMVMKPDFLILDEPTSQMDPVSANRFLQTLVRLNQDFGIAMILSEQRLEEVLPIADRVFLMHGGSIVCEGEASETARLLEVCERKTGVPFPVRGAMPVALRVFVACEDVMNSSARSPLSVREGREWLRTQTVREEGGRAYREGQAASAASGTDRVPGGKGKKRLPELALQAKGVSFSYGSGNPVLEDFCLRVERGSFYAILGGNGSGKTTALKLLSGVYPKCGRGKVLRKGRVLYLAQNPQSLFTEVTAEEELAEMLFGGTASGGKRADGNSVRERVEHMLDFLDLAGMRHHNPMDLSGGEKQRLALGKILLREPDVLLLDEPTKGLDAAFKEKLSDLFARLRREGMTIVMASHDMEFCAANATHCGLLFDGSIISDGTAREFFAGNSLYTTAAARMAEGILEDCVLDGDIISQLRTRRRV